MTDRVGLFEATRGGTLLLDEIGEMPGHLQTKLLRVLQDRQAQPLGGGPIVNLDFRLICATNCDLRAATEEGRFRQDLYFRINTITVPVTPLRERPEDISLLIDLFLQRFGAQYGHCRPHWTKRPGSGCLRTNGEATSGSWNMRLSAR